MLKYLRSSTKTFQIGQQCDDPKSMAEIFCLDCSAPKGAALCFNCAKRLHPPMTKLHAHRQVAYQDKPHQETCPLHAGKKLELFCFECEKLICKYCKDFGECLGHDFGDIGIAGKRKRVDVRDALTKARKHEETLVKCNRKVADTSREVVRQASVGLGVRERTRLEVSRQ